MLDQQKVIAEMFRKTNKLETSVGSMETKLVAVEVAVAAAATALVASETKLTEAMRAKLHSVDQKIGHFYAELDGKLTRETSSLNKQVNDHTLKLGQLLPRK